MRRTHVICSGAAALLVFAVCGGDEERESGRESEWRLSGEPIVRIGVIDGAEEYQFHRVAGARRLQTGQIVVADAGAQELRLFDSSGRHLRTVGGPGGGPGEYRGLASVEPYRADSLLVFDDATWRVSILEGNGDFARSWEVVPPGRGVFPQRALPLVDGSVVIVHFRGHMPGDPPGTIRFTAPIVRFSADGSLLNVIKEVSGEEWYRSSELGSLAYAPFGRKGFVAVSGTSVFIGDSGLDEVQMYDGSGEMLNSLRVPHARVPVDAADIRTYREQQLAAVEDPEGAHRLQRLLDEMDYPTSMPAYARLLVDQGGNVWLQEYNLDQHIPARWRVVAPDGRLLGFVATPPDLRLEEVGEDFVLGVRLDPLDVEYVELYELTRSRGFD